MLIREIINFIVELMFFFKQISLNLHRKEDVQTFIMENMHVNVTSSLTIVMLNIKL